MARQTVAVVGTGAWGTALAVILARAGHAVTLYARRPIQFEALLAHRENRLYLPGVRLPDSVTIARDWRAALADSNYVVLAVPSTFMRTTLESLSAGLKPGAVLVSATKGIESPSLLTMTEVIAQFATDSKLAALSGPGFAAEVARGLPAALVVAAPRQEVAADLQALMATPSLRIYRSTDLRGVEMAGAAKNVIAIAAGICEGLALGQSARAALITRGLAEMIRLGDAIGAQRQTITGLSGLGDLVLTCTGQLSRNRALGMRLGTGETTAGSLAVAAEGMPIAEGASNARAISRLAARHQVEMPIVSAVYRCLYEERPPKAMVEELLSRELKAEY